jgi:hypothetical protein
VFRAQAEWILILPSATYRESAASPADKYACARPVLLAHTVYFFPELLIKYSNNIVLTVREDVQNVCPLL